MGLRVKNEKLSLHDSKELKSWLDNEYRKYGFIANNWTDFLMKFKNEFKPMRNYSNSYLEAVIRKEYKLARRKITPRSVKTKPEEFWKYNFAIALKYSKLLLEEKRILYLDESSINHSNFQKHAIGNAHYPPVKPVRKGDAQFFIFCVVEINGIVSIQLSSKALNQVSFKEFLEYTLQKFL